MATPFELTTYANRHFSNISDRIDREHAAETALVREFFRIRPAEYFVDVGANDPQWLSQSWHLEQHGWRGLLVEPVPELCVRLRKERPASTVIQAACCADEGAGEAEFFVAHDLDKSTLQPDLIDFNTTLHRTIRVRLGTLNELLREADLPRVDFVSIDVEGLQLDVLRGFDLAAHRPRLVLIEDHLTDLKTHRSLVSGGYRLVKRTGLNSWYIPANETFELTTRSERFDLWKKVWLRTPARKLKFALRRRRAAA
ncbi:MAG: FkbM family methyltransferase [Planctomycetota bacterium]|nr:FkbM family methyltransferase [Planctomycetota bacterium]